MKLGLEANYIGFRTVLNINNSTYKNIQNHNIIKSLDKDLNLSDIKKRRFTPAHWFLSLK